MASSRATEASAHPHGPGAAAVAAVIGLVKLLVVVLQSSPRVVSIHHSDSRPECTSGSNSTPTRAQISVTQVQVRISISRAAPAIYPPTPQRSSHSKTKQRRRRRVASDSETRMENNNQAAARANALAWFDFKVSLVLTSICLFFAIAFALYYALFDEPSKHPGRDDNEYHAVMVVVSAICFFVGAILACRHVILFGCSLPRTPAPEKAAEAEAPPTGAELC